MKFMEFSTWTQCYFFVRQGTLYIYELFVHSCYFGENGSSETNSVRFVLEMMVDSHIPRKLEGYSLISTPNSVTIIKFEIERTHNSSCKFT